MAGDNDVYAEGHWINLQRPEVVKYENSSASEPHEFGVGLLARPITRVHVPSDGHDRSNPAKRVDDVWLPNITGVNNLVDPSQTPYSLGP